MIGGGAAGLMAATAAAENAGCRVLLFDCNERLGKKIYATGNGRCNLTNLDMREECYNQPVLERIRAFDSVALMAFFRDRGVYLHDRNGYVYPRTDQAATIVDALVRELRSRENVEIHINTSVQQISESEHSYVLRTVRSDSSMDVETISVNRVILASGGLAGKSSGCGPTGYALARSLGHSITTTAPALVPVTVEDPLRTGYWNSVAADRLPNRPRRLRYAPAWPCRAR